jgi:hypothetical protein
MEKDENSLEASPDFFNFHVEAQHHYKRRCLGELEASSLSSVDERTSSWKMILSQPS